MKSLNVFWVSLLFVFLLVLAFIMSATRKGYSNVFIDNRCTSVDFNEMSETTKIPASHTANFLLPGMKLSTTIDSSDISAVDTRCTEVSVNCGACHN
ncbi:hypothetical protein DBZ36_00300 [Alginatibacterium sediminis]|uniref:Transmembrane protein n=1 Tax=Alginatibacterium sediminis TaxID=2164068 RepID=A0A420EN96_9ALTE|nr:hypothetical protein DBZ36_00300 [Alginatibacterium sediminis]